MRALRSRTLLWTLSWTAAAAFYLLLVDSRRVPLLLVGAGVATVAAAGAQLTRREAGTEMTIRPTMVLGIPRAVVQVPGDILRLAGMAMRQLRRPGEVNGAFRAVGFRCGSEETAERGRRALAESMGSFAPNTIIIGIDAASERLLAHQLCRRSDVDTLDPLRLR